MDNKQDSVGFAYLNWLRRLGAGTMLALAVALPYPFIFLHVMTQWAMVMAAALVCATYATWKILSKITSDKFANFFERQSDKQTRLVELIPPKYVPLAVIASAALSLVLELVVIRWQTCEIDFLAFFKNFGLIACFAGLGIGYSLARSKTIPLICSVITLTLQVVFINILEGLLITKFLHQPPVVEQVSIVAMRLQNTGLAYWITAYSILAFLFLATAMCFIPIGQLCGATMARMKSLPAYGSNLLGSLIGVLLMTSLSYAWAPPAAWFFVCLCLTFYFAAYDRRSALATGLLSFFLLMLVAIPNDPMHLKIYSPYQLIEVYTDKHGWPGITASGYYYQKAYDLTKQACQAYPDLQRTASYYDLPYNIKPGAKNVLILGAGAGNDVSAALRAGVEHIDAVEIDPAIAAFGKEYHPEKPYDDKRVHLVLDDGRAFLRKTKSKYDLVVYALIDSHALSSSGSALRVDSYIYTLESFRKAKECLQPDGMMALSFVSEVPDLQKKVFGMLKTAFDDHEPMALCSNYDYSTSFFETLQGAPSIPADVAGNPNLVRRTELSALSNQFEPSTDDWPFFYMPHRQFPFSYLPLMGLVIGLAIWLQSSFKKSKFSAANLPYFWLGAGFMLVETKAITELGLQFGNTWLVTAIVVGSVISMAFCSNLLVAKVQFKNVLFPGVLLIAALVLSALVSRHVITGLEGNAWAMTAVLTCPIVFSGIVFSILISRVKDIGSAMAMNIIGALFGGVLEYNAMCFGYGALYIIAIGIYVIAIANVVFMKENSSE